MKRMWKHKWVVGGVALVIFLSIGTAAWAATGGGNGNGAVTGVAQTNVCAATIAATATGQTSGSDTSALGTRRAAMKERMAQLGKRQQALLDLLRDKMSAADQAKYDQLVQQAKDQRTALQKARTDLTSTMKDLRALTQKYIDAQTGTTSTTDTSTQ